MLDTALAAGGGGAAAEVAAQSAVTAAGTNAASGGILDGFGGQLLTKAATGVGSSLIQSALLPDKINIADPAAPVAASPASPQAAVSPNAAAIRAATGTALQGQGQDSTLLAGTATDPGVSTDKYRIGKSTLLAA
jgi:hypothetical protein